MSETLFWWLAVPLWMIALYLAMISDTLRAIKNRRAPLSDCGSNER